MLRDRYSHAAQSGSRRIVYGEMQGGVVFIPHVLAIELATIHQALQTAGTWGEFKLVLHESRRKELQHLFEIHGVQDADGDQINEHFLAGIHWPEFPVTEMSEWLPASIVKLSKTSAWLDGTYVLFPPADEGKILAALTKKGFSCVKCQDLINRACGD